MVLTTTARTNLYYAPLIYEHWHHWRGTHRTIQCAGKFNTTMRAKKTNHRACGDLKLGSEIIATVQARKPKPTLLVVRGYGYTD
jgi:hypothetical protein